MYTHSPVRYPPPPHHPRHHHHPLHCCRYGDANRFIRAIFTLAAKLEPAVIFIGVCVCVYLWSCKDAVSSKQRLAWLSVCLLGVVVVVVVVVVIIISVPLYNSTMPVHLP